MAVLVTGGAGYIGSHTCVELLNAGYEVVVVDNLYNSSEKALERVEGDHGKEAEILSGRSAGPRGGKRIFDQESIQAVIHFAGLKGSR